MPMEKILLESLKNGDNRISFHAIRILYKEAGVNGWLIYLREMTKDYPVATGDILDDAIFDAARAFFPDSYWQYHVPIFYKKQLEYLKVSTPGHKQNPIIIEFIPSFEDPPVEMSFQLISFQATFNCYFFDENKSVIVKDWLKNRWIVSLPIDKYSLTTTLREVQ